MKDRPGGFYYGWVIVWVMAASGAVSMAMGSLNFGLFIKPMGDDLGIGRAAFGWAHTARQGASSVTSPADTVHVRPGETRPGAVREPNRRLQAVSENGTSEGIGSYSSSGRRTTRT